MSWVNALQCGGCLEPHDMDTEMERLWRLGGLVDTCHHRQHPGELQYCSQTWEGGGGAFISSFNLQANASIYPFFNPSIHTSICTFHLYLNKELDPVGYN